MSRCLGHVLQMDENRIATTVLHGRVEGLTTRGRQRTTCLKSTLSGYEVGPQALMDIAQDGNKWRSMLIQMQYSID